MWITHFNWFSQTQWRGWKQTTKYNTDQISCILLRPDSCCMRRYLFIYSPPHNSRINFAQNKSPSVHLSAPSPQYDIHVYASIVVHHRKEGWLQMCSYCCQHPRTLHRWPTCAWWNNCEHPFANMLRISLCLLFLFLSMDLYCHTHIYTLFYNTYRHMDTYWDSLVHVLPQDKSHYNKTWVVSLWALCP